MAAGTFNRRGWAALSHLPDAGGWLFQADWQILHHSLAYTRRVEARCGSVARTVLGGQPQVLLLSATALETVLLDRGRVFSAEGGWSSLMGQLFPRGLLLRDGEDHRRHRRLMLPSVRREALEGYLTRMAPRVQATVAQWWRDGRVASLPALRRLTLTCAADIFLALQDPADMAQAVHDFDHLVEAATALVRLPLLGRKYARGLEARRRLVARLHRWVLMRRQDPGDDLLSQLCLARDEDGQHLSDEEITDHLVFLMMAAHDTTAGALASTLAHLAVRQDWQDRLRDEARGGDEPVLLNAVLREVLRLHPPVPMFLRRTTEPCEVDGHRLPAQALVGLFPLHVQRQALWWPDPDRFVPERHLGTPAETRHPYAWTPYGGGVHLCLGLHLADAQMKLVVGECLRAGRWHWAGDRAPVWRHAPISHPAGPAPLRLQAC